MEPGLDLKLTKRSEYAVKILVELASYYGQKAVLSREIAEKQGLPGKFVPQIVNDLQKAGLISTARGAGGGITITSHPSKITVKDAIEAVEGPIAINHCLLEPGVCSRQLECQLFGLWGEAQKKMVEVLEGVSIKDLFEAKSGQAVKSKSYLIPQVFSEVPS